MCANNRSKLNSGKKQLSDGALPRAVAEDLGVSVATFYRWVPGEKSGDKPLADVELVEIREHEPKRRGRVVSTLV